MKKQVIQVLWSIANGQPQTQGEAVVYPNIREQLNAIKALMSIKGWEEEEIQPFLTEQPTTIPEYATTPIEQPTTIPKCSTIVAEQPTTAVERPNALPPLTFAAPRPNERPRRPARKKQLFIKGTSIPIS